MIREAHRHVRIAMDPKVLGGKPVIRGTRVPVELVLAYLGDGQTVEEIVEAFPGLTAEDVRAAVAFAADVVADEAVTLAEA